MKKIYYGLLAVVLVCLVGSAALAYAADVSESLSNLERKEGIKASYTLHPATGAVRMLKGQDDQPLYLNTLPDATLDAVARGFLGQYGKLFGLGGDQEYVTKKTTKDGNGNSFVRFQQHYMGLPIVAAEIVVQGDPSLNIMSVLGKTSPSPLVNTTPSLSSAAAQDRALQVTAKYHGTDVSGLSASQPVLSIYNPSLLNSNALNSNILVWQIEVTPYEIAPIRQFVLVNAQTGGIALTFNQIPDAKNRVVYDKNNDKTSQTLPGLSSELKRSEGGAASGITDVDKAYQYAGDTYDFYFTVHGRDSIDGAGMQLVNTVRYCENSTTSTCPYQNAYWSGTQMVYGDGFTRSEDVVGHELTHGVTEKTSNLYYYMQSGSINESFSDVWGEFVQQQYNPPSASNRWLMGENLSIGAIRSMKDPTVFGDPDMMTSASYTCGTNDQGGVHTNSGVNNKAVFLMTDGGTFNGQTITGIGLTKVAKIYYSVQTNLLTSGGDYADLYNALQLACGSLVGTSGITTSDCQQVKNALDAVAMSQQPTNCAATEAPLCDAGTGVPVNTFYDDFESGGSKWTLTSATTSTGATRTVWTAPTTGYAKSGDYSLYAEDVEIKSDTNARMKTAVTIPSNAYLYFDHAYEFEFYTSPTASYFDGGIVEYSSNSGSTWTDAQALFTTNGYNKTLDSGSALGGKKAFAGLSNGYISSRLNLSTLAGQNILFRFRAASDSSVGAMGWVIDNVRIYTCQVTVPDAPTGVSAAAGNGQATVNFMVSQSDGGSAITGYIVTSSTGSFTATGTASPITVTGLTNGTAYTFTVKATNAIGTSAASAASNSVTPAIATAPGAPIIGQATASSGQAMITFAVPASDGGSAITGYTVTSNPGNITATGAASPITVTGLTNGTTYTFTVKATNAVGTGAASAASNSVTPAAFPSGDIDGGGVSVTDALKALRFAAKLDTPTSTDLSNGDVAPLVNGVPQPDGVIDVGDAVVILRRAVGLISW